MKKQYLSSKYMQKYNQRAHDERSQAFHASMRLVGKSVKYLFSQPEKVSEVCSKKLTQIQQAAANAANVTKSHCH